ncbi:MAG TPA: molecular chaperone DnaJ [Gemmatimonadales bacterium]|nr:molecular chaperone DnaJ [Gemmatimonadales bacterium]HRZ09376.1 molecular chaperone DnaJ [Gemmatimonadales bacterium]
MSDFYSLLGVERGATEADIKKAYRKLAMELHPDRNSSHDAESRFKEVTEAYEVLRDPQKRAAYDRYGKAGVGRGGAGFEYHHVDLTEALNIFMRDFGGLGGFESLFGGGGGGRTVAEARRGQDIRVTVRMTLAEVATGVKRTIKLKTLDACEHCGGTGAKKGTSAAACGTCGGNGEVRRAARSVFGQFVQVAPCPTCGGEGTVIRTPCEVCRGEGRVRAERTVQAEIPAGVSTNNYLTMRGQGAAGPRNGGKGDLLLLIEVEEDDRFERQGEHLATDLPLSFSQAALGGTYPVPTPWGEEEVVVPSGTQTATVLRLKGKGLPRLGQAGRGDLHIRINVWTPERLNPEQERLFRELAEHEGEPPGQGKGFWSRIREALG